jgi:hypothetical protein
MSLGPERKIVMYMIVENAQIVSARPLEPRAPDPGREPKAPQCEVKVLANGPRGGELKTFKAPFKDLADFMTKIGQIVEEIKVDVNEWDMNGRKGVSYTIADDSGK